MPSLVIAKGELWLHADGAAPQQITSPFAREVMFSMIYGKEPLRSAGGPRTPELEQDVHKIWLRGRLIDLQRVLVQRGDAAPTRLAQHELIESISVG